MSRLYGHFTFWQFCRFLLCDPPEEFEGMYQIQSHSLVTLVGSADRIRRSVSGILRRICLMLRPAICVWLNSCVGKEEKDHSIHAHTHTHLVTQKRPREYFHAQPRAQPYRRIAAQARTRAHTDARSGNLNFKSQRKIETHQTIYGTSATRKSQIQRAQACVTRFCIRSCIAVHTIKRGLA